ncbi:hypothetical protein EYB26_008640 [Talaromyces marneffei]|uniref:uncharacterized protein n=1 Tax=Talaromyces marneffei TaxID=37727 RepID=UPI0012AA907C|nr:uncharacterized protein EYB26_008640 [Talaromyces marneffei]QGA20930.1 hypothetical protein EYB26_008640 [Talaromyces marneffei]
MTTHVLTIQQDVDPKQGEILFAIIGAVSLAMIIISTFPVLKKRIYEIFLRTHQALAILFFYSIWRHLSLGSVFLRLYLYIPLSILYLITVYQVRRGFTATLQQRTTASGSASFCAFLIGLFGISHSLSQYKTVVTVASNAGITGVVPYLKQLLYSYNILIGQIRRLHLVWEVDTLDMVVEAQPLLNDLLKDDSLTNGYISHTRKPDYNKIISTEVADDYIERIPNTPERTGEILILTSVSNRLRDHLKSVVCRYLGKKVTMQEVDYRPSEVIAQ